MEGDNRELLVIYRQVLKTNIGTSLFRPMELLIALIAICKVNSLLTPFSSNKIILYIQHNDI
jgi:hypothetical protein